MVLSLPPCIFTGVAAPMFVPGAMAATAAAIVINTPADAARAPDGLTQLITGTRAARMSLIISRMLVSSPPGVSISISNAV
jgi:hypothetical protein